MLVWGAHLGTTILTFHKIMACAWVVEPVKVALSKGFAQAGKFVFCMQEIFFPVKFVRLEKPPLLCLYICNGIYFKYFSNFVHLIGCCMHGSLLVHGKSSAHTTYLPV